MVSIPLLLFSIQLGAYAVRYILEQEDWQVRKAALETIATLAATVKVGEDSMVLHIISAIGRNIMQLASI